MELNGGGDGVGTAGCHAREGGRGREPADDNLMLKLRQARAGHQCRNLSGRPAFT